jgi:hypothetical protein
MGRDATFSPSFSLNSQWLRKRSRALRGRNPTRDTQSDSAPTVHQPLAGPTCQGCFFLRPVGHPSYALKILGPGAKPQFFTHRFCGRPQNMKTLESINSKPANEFWKEVDEKKLDKKK